ncbi:SPOR domain-containing protein [Sulfuricurvum sp.]|uniref:SPOR domain-containing protein n=1 Tax=Sulfuricurvum sp. TaxID=2025608 RepID=UPI00356962EF
MEEKNELNDIILNKSGGSSGSKKLLLAIATLTLILIIVLVIMNSLKSESTETAPQAATPPEPSAPTEIINDPLFEPVEVIQEGNNSAQAAKSSEDLGQIAQKIKQESFSNAPAQNTVVPASVPVAQQNAPVVQSKPVPQNIPAAIPAPTAPKIVSKPIQAKPVETAVQPAPIKKTAPVVNTPTIKTTKSAEVKKAQPAPAVKSADKVVEKPVEKVTEKPAQKAAEAGGTWYIQVGSFTNTPNKALYEQLNASGLKYTNVPSGAVTKVMIGPFQGEKAANDVLGTVRKNIESHAFKVKG